MRTALLLLMLVIAGQALAAPPVIVWDRPAPRPPDVVETIPVAGGVERDSSDGGVTVWGLLLMEPASREEYAFIAAAQEVCRRWRGASADPFMLLALHRMEGDLGAPSGLLVGAWCVEASFRSESSSGGPIMGDGGFAFGPLQLHRNIWEADCGGDEADPHDLLWSAGCYWYRVTVAMEKARKVTRCREKDVAGVAEAAVANVGRYRWDCSLRSAHWRVMDAIRKLWRN